MSSIMFVFCLAIICISTLSNYVVLPQSHQGSKYLTNYYRRKATDSLDLSPLDVSNAILFASATIASLKRLEENILHAQVGSYQKNIISDADSSAFDIAKRAYIMEKATLYLIGRHCYKNFFISPKCLRVLKQLNASEMTTPEVCNTPFAISCGDGEFRTLDGSCNHRTAPSLGAALTNYKRLLPAEYLDSVQVPRRSIFNKYPLLSAREVTQRLVIRDNDAAGQSSKLTLAVAYWGEFIEHDMAETVAFKMDGSKLSPRHLHPKCDAIDIPEADSFFKQHNIKCLNYVRSVAGIQQDCSFGPIDQLNQATHYLDASHIYGTHARKAKFLRTGSGGQMRTITGNGGMNVNGACPETNGKCFESSDHRMNSNPHIALLYTLFLREHNRLAKMLWQLHPEWADEILFQETRRIVMAEIQHITYTEWLPLLLSRRNLNIVLNATSYQETTDPRISNSFATAAIRFSQSLLPASIKLLNENRSVNRTVNRRDDFVRTQFVEGIVGALLRGLVTQKSRKLDLTFAKDLADFYDVDIPGLDIISLDVQRGRDHGLPSYNAYRKLCGLPEAREFNEFAPTLASETIKALASVYKHPKDVDLIIGGMAEQRQDAGMLGPTFSCIVTDQFRRTRAGDRHFFSFAMPLEQVRALRRTSLAHLICANGGDGVGRLQRHAFLPPGDGNPLVACDKIDGIDLRAWK